MSPREFALPFKPEELLAQPCDDRLWAEDCPDVESWSAKDIGTALDALIGRILSSHGKDLAEPNSFSFLFALLQAWPRLPEGVCSRIADLLADAVRRLVANTGGLWKKALKSEHNGQGRKSEHNGKDRTVVCENRTAIKVAVFFLRWAFERSLQQSLPETTGNRGRGRGGRHVEVEENMVNLRGIEKQRYTMLTTLSGMSKNGALAWLWLGDAVSWQQIAERISDAGFLVLYKPELLKQREVRQLALNCIADPLMQEGQHHSNLLVATVSKLAHSLRVVEGAATFTTDVLLRAHTTSLPRLLLVDLTQHCNASELTATNSFPRSLASVLVAMAEKLPHIVLANISVFLPLLDVDCYPLRSGIVESIGQLLFAEGTILPEGAKLKSEKLDDQVAVSEGAESSQPESRFAIATSTKKDLLDTLMARVTDKTSWVRVKTLASLTNLAAKKRVAIPRDQWPRLLQIAVQRMQDCASSVRKAAMQLAKILIEFHPYGPALSGAGDEHAKAERVLAEIADRARRLNALELAAVTRAAAAAGRNSEFSDVEGDELMGFDEPVAHDQDGTDADETLSGDNSGESHRRLRKKTCFKTEEASEIDKCLMVDDHVSDDADDRKRQHEALAKMRDCYIQRLRFVDLIDSAGARLQALLTSRSVSDVTEAIGVVVELHLRELPAAATASNQILGLVWSRHTNVKEAAVEAFCRMHLEGRDADGAVSALLEMYEKGCSTNSWTHTHLASVQEIVQQAAEKKLMQPCLVIPRLMVALEGSSSPMALRALVAFCAVEPATISAELPTFLKLFSPGGAATGKSSAEQLVRMRLVCQLLQRLHNSSQTQLEGDTRQHLWNLVLVAAHLLVTLFSKGDVPPEWFVAAQAIVDVSFELGVSAPVADNAAQKCPDKFWGLILAGMLQNILGAQSQHNQQANPKFWMHPVWLAKRKHHVSDTRLHLWQVLMIRLVL